MSAVEFSLETNTKWYASECGEHYSKYVLRVVGWVSCYPSVNAVFVAVRVSLPESCRPPFVYCILLIKSAERLNQHVKAARRYT